MQVPRTIAIAAFASVAVLVGCNHAVHTDLTFQRGVQLLAAGSPKSAIPLFMQVIASAPDGPEPHAMLSLAYALDLQSDRAMRQAKEARRISRATDQPGWAGVAMAIAEMSEHNPAEAVRHLEQVIAAAPQGSPIGWAAGQWWTLALILKADHAKAAESLGPLAERGPTRMTAMLWGVVIHAQQRQAAEAAESLIQCAKEVSQGSGQDPGKRAAADMDDQALYDEAIAAVALGDFAKADAAFRALHQRSPGAGDVPVWLAMLTAVSGNWTAARDKLKDASQVGSIRSQALANHLLGVIYATEARPDSMIRSMVAGQRLLSRGGPLADITTQPRPDVVWFSDRMK